MTPAAAATTSESVRSATLDFTMPAMNRATAPISSPRLVKIIGSLLRSGAGLLRLEHPLVAAHHHRVAAGPRFSWELRCPRDGVAEARVERAELVGRGHEVLARHRVL